MDTGVAVGLKESNKPPFSDFVSKSLEGHTDFCRMVGIIIKELKSMCFSFEFKSPLCSLEILKCFSDRLFFDSKRERKPENCASIESVVFAKKGKFYIQIRFPFIRN